MNQADPFFRKPNPFERIFNKVFGALVGLGIGLRHNYLVEVPGRRTGRLYSTPIDLLELEGRRFLVAPRGRTQWVRNAETAGEVVLKKGTKRQRFRIRVVPNEEKPDILKAYLDCFRVTVQRYFPVQAGSEPRAFAAVAERYPVFDLLAFDSPRERNHTETEGDR
ncbi:MAG: nitroreductase family deazaflavin-dependent oxidoreductase [Deltaproteobacteria bacterium]|nr:nitroreductase family deazaflavin-dependent oxidoreductase [Deltaproteobacteria bacterium]